MGSVEELCDNIALINKSEKILDGSVKEIRKTHRTNTYKVSFRGNVMGFTNALWSGAEILQKESDDDVNTFTIRLLNNLTPNQMLQLVLPTCEITGFQEIIPSMNDIFIMKVNQNHTNLGTQSNYTE